MGRVLKACSAMTMKPFPSKSHIRWRRIDVPGREEARIEQTANGWRLTGQLEVEEGGVSAQLVYLIECERDWRTRQTVVTGSASGAPMRFEFSTDGAGHWTLNGAPLPLVEGALDIDLGFTPATNLLPIRPLGPRGGRARGYPDRMGAVSRATGRGAGAILPA